MMLNMMHSLAVIVGLAVEGSVVIDLADQLSAVSQCIVSLADQSYSRSVYEILFPSVHDDLHQCSTADNKYCYLQLQYHVDSSVLSSASGITSDPSEVSEEYRLSLSLGACVPSFCKSSYFEIMGKVFCGIPSCTLLHTDSLISLCTRSQKLYCDPDDRTSSQRSVHMVCMERAPHMPRELQSVFSVNESPESSALSEQVASFCKDQGDSECSFESSELTLPEPVFTSLLECGAGTFRQWPLLMHSGGVNSLGDYSMCERSGGNYCTLKYMKMVTSGRCLPESCPSTSLQLLNDAVCNDLGLGPAWKEDMVVNATCLDYANIIPLDLCLQTQVMGCSNQELQRRAMQDPDNVMSILLSLLEVEDNSGTEFDDEHEYALPDSHVLMGSYYYGNLRDAISNVDWEGLSTSLLQLEGVSKSLGSVDMYCTLDPPADVPRVQKVGFTMFMGACILFFNVLPLVGFVSVYVLKRYQKKKTSYVKVPVISESFDYVRGIDPEVLLLSHPPEDDDASSSDEDLNRKSSRMERFLTWLGIFYVPNNVKYLLKRSQNQKAIQLDHMAGIRVISIMWIILGHSFSFTAMSGTVRNLGLLLKSLKSLSMQLVISGQYAVDTFFFLSGFVLSYFGVKLISNLLQNDKCSHTVSRCCRCCQLMRIYVYGAVKRYVRLSGLYFFLLAFFVFGFDRLDTGPNWPVIANLVHHGNFGGCDKFAWTNLLYINNLYPRKGCQDCFGWAWYLANDFQFYLLCFALLLVRSQSVRTFRVLSGLVFLASIVAGFVVVIKNGIHINVMLLSQGGEAINTDNSTLHIVTVMERYYMKPWTRFPPYGVGFFFGLLHRKEWFKSLVVHERPSLKETSKEDLEQVEDTRPTRERKDMVLFLHSFVAFWMLFTIYIQYTANREGVSAQAWPRPLEVLYLVFSRGLWAVCVGWFTCVLSYAKGTDSLVKDRLTRGINAFLANSTFVYLSNLVFSAYLIHPLIQQAYGASTSQAIWMTEARGYLDAVATITASFLLGAHLVVHVEAVLASFFSSIGI